MPKFYRISNKSLRDFDGCIGHQGFRSQRPILGSGLAERFPVVIVPQNNIHRITHFERGFRGILRVRQGGGFFSVKVLE